MDKNSRKAFNRYMRNYMREWRAKNPDKCKAYRERYWKRRAAQEAAVKKEVHEKKEVNSVNG